MCDFYGSNLWNLFSMTDSLFTEWNKCIRFVFRLPFMTHRYLIEPLSESCHLKTMLINRFVKFYTSLQNNTKPSIRNLFSIQANDVRSDFGSNISHILSKCHNNDILNFDKLDFSYHPIANDDVWRVNVIKELMTVKYNFLNLEYDSNDINSMILMLTCN